MILPSLKFVTKTRKTRLNYRAGFTIVELFVVVVIIAVLATITVTVRDEIIAKSRDATRTADIKKLKEAMQLYWHDNGGYPAACALPAYGCYVDTLNSYLIPKYLPAMPDDPLAPERRYQYVWGEDKQSYALRIQYETAPTCKIGQRVPVGWWEASTPMCK